METMTAQRQSKIKVISADDLADALTLDEVWKRIWTLYSDDPAHAVRSQELIKTLHHYLAISLYKRLSKRAIDQGVQVLEEAPIFGSYKQKDVDVAVVDPHNGPLITVGVRSQMSSIGKNILTYYQDIIGECISLQERFPMMTMGYVYLHPLRYPGKNGEAVETDVARYSKLYASISDRDDKLYKHQVGSYDQFAYAVVDFDQIVPQLRDDLVSDAVQEVDLSIKTFTNRMVETFRKRNIWLDWLFE